jgi:hypothetical protein
MSRERVVSLFDVDDVTEFCPVREMQVHRAPRADVEEFCQRWHYTHHRGSVGSWDYGLYDGVVLVGVVSYNIPTMPVCESLFGQERWEWVAHMGRLVCAEDAPRNTESRLIGGSLHRFKIDRPTTRGVVTYAAQGEGHVGYVYQATNALYVGTTEAKGYYVDPLGRRRSPKFGAPSSGGQGNIKKSLALSWGWTVHDDLPKHRYVYLLGNKTERREARALLNLPVLPYPKAVTA